MLQQSSQIVRLGVGELIDAGPGIFGYQSWIITFVVLLVLAGLAWWTMRPVRRATRNQRRKVARQRVPAPQQAGQDVEPPREPTRPGGSDE